MDLRQLKYFHAVVNAGSLSAASATLNLSQPAIGMQIRSLEEALELKLLTRHARGVRPTPAGQALYEHADRVLHELENARRALNRFRVEGTGAVPVLGTMVNYYNMLKQGALTVWLKARPADHLARVAAQGDRRPMAGRAEPWAPRLQPGGALRRRIDVHHHFAPPAWGRVREGARRIGS